MSLNNRIAIRASDNASGVIVDRQVVSGFRSGAPSEPTKDIVTLEIEKPQKDLINQPVVEVEAEERVNSESCNFQVIVPLFYALSSSRGWSGCRH